MAKRQILAGARGLGLFMSGSLLAQRRVGPALLREVFKHVPLAAGGGQAIHL